ncbi:hypothetical protein AT5G14275 [Arabidopsis thaliana]|jgi:hypothetical protein|uniref:Uncharacterized protein n=2 Tax=Arabidopsis thaliana TaxID=3702 RepID=A0A5S9Y4L7_ARATH|nr:uncharacterized protein AT5G14275 [Arabidopsis thaliana]ANM71198.1 hypothetical protein AT5G14275 [Arabidopsis thaliana]CAA0402523.1 unnamed protein product [Arabidopsis thaliana]|eukprot:NP_001332744.1 hypothetical protein AT5G14275 [Arabidopsis thaliana]
MIQNPNLSDSNLNSSCNEDFELPDGSKHQNREKEETHRLNFRAIEKIDDPTEAEDRESKKKRNLRGVKTLKC